MLEGKTILIMGIRNKWSIAYGIAEAITREGGKLVFIYKKSDSDDKVLKLISEFEGAISYKVDDATNEESVKNIFLEIKNNVGKIDGFVHAIAHANVEDLHNDFIDTSKEGFIHALDTSSYSFVMISRLLKDINLLNEGASILTLSYLGSTRVLRGYNVMGVAKAALESSVRYLAENFGTCNIRVNALSPGPIKTVSARGIKDFNKMLDIVEEKAPLHRNVSILEVGNIAAFLLSSYASALTGQVIYADNGYSVMGE